MHQAKKPREKLLKLILAHPEACSARLRELSQSDDGLRKVALCFDSLGYSYARLLFSAVPSEDWDALQRMTSAITIRASEAARSENLQALYQSFFSFCLGWDPARVSEEASLSFLRQLSATHLHRVLSEESPSEIATLSVVLAPYEMDRVVQALPESTRLKVILAMDRVKRLPAPSLRDPAISFLKRIQEKYREFCLASAAAEERVVKALQSINCEREHQVIALIQEHLPSLGKMLGDQGYTESADQLSRKLDNFLTQS